ncbi:MULTISPECIES: hypothetical protein [unclassified Pseudomonas]|uniref:hypothetical protein n=1 Tax=unclassified Pseudomonas TaxID=196821 RepID=UPI000472CC11|nr:MULTISPECIES: hypothetical protein [unclassified Pseudomonas]
MSSFLASAVYHTHVQAKKIGLDALSRAQLSELTAPLLGYETRRNLTERLTKIQQAIARPDAAILVNERAAVRKAAAFLEESEKPVPAARRYVGLLIENIRQEVSAPVYEVDGAFLDDHLDPHVPAFFLAELHRNDEVRAAHEKVNAPCGFVEIDDVDDVTNIWTSRDQWRVSCGVVISPKGPDGKAYHGGEYLLAGTQVEYEKLDRAVISIKPYFYPAWATANRYHAGMGGERIR